MSGWRSRCCILLKWLDCDHIAHILTAGIVSMPHLSHIPPQRCAETLQAMCYKFARTQSHGNWVLETHTVMSYLPMIWRNRCNIHVIIYWMRCLIDGRVTMSSADEREVVWTSSPVPIAREMWVLCNCLTTQPSHATNTWDTLSCCCMSLWHFLAQEGLQSWRSCAWFYPSSVAPEPHSSRNIYISVWLH